MTPLQEQFIGDSSKPQYLSAQEIREISPIIEVTEGKYRLPKLSEMPLSSSCISVRKWRGNRADTRCADEILNAMDGYAFGIAYNKPDKYIAFAFITDNMEIMLYDPQTCNWDRHALTNIYIGN
jgi:hypothetical protein